jgi:hypothetical protein
LGVKGIQRSWAVAYLESGRQPAYGQAFIRTCHERFSSLMHEEDALYGC